MEDWSKDILESLANKEVTQDKELYNSKFFQDHLKYRPIYNFIGDIIAAKFKPKSVIDWGCGCGFLLERLYGHGIENILGIEGSSDVIPIWQSELATGIADHLVIADVTKPIEDVGVYELAICMEVAEHIMESKVGMLVSQICKSSSGLVWWTAAQPGQGGTGHITLKPTQYWTDLFKEFDFEVDWEKTYEIKQIMLQNHAIALAYPWYRDNLVILRKNVL